MLESRFVCGLLAVLCSSVGHAEVRADEPFGLCGTSRHATQPTENSLAGRQVELFKAVADGDIDAELIAPSAREVWLRVTNKTDKLLTIDLPDAFAAVPVLGQLAPAGNFGFPGAGAGNNFGAGQNFGNFGNAQPGFAQGGQGLAGQGLGGQGIGGQGLGGGFNNGGNGVGNLGLGNVGGGNMLGNGIGNPAALRGMFRVPAGRTGKVRAQTVCLEHGKPEPNSRMRYRLVPIEEFHGDPRIARICHLLASRQITQNVAQAAAWHIANDLSWEELAAKERSRSKYTGSQKFFTSSELREAMRVAQTLQPATSVLTFQTSTSSALSALSASPR